MGWAPSAQLTFKKNLSTYDLFKESPTHTINVLYILYNGYFVIFFLMTKEERKCIKYNNKKYGGNINISRVNGFSVS